MAEDCGGCSAAAGGLGERPVGLGTLNSCQVRFVYLITYSQANLHSVLTQEEFSRIVLDSFSNADTCSHVEEVQWACSQEEHRDGGIHYHMAVKLSARCRWLKVRNYLEDRHRVKVNFSDKHCNYYWCYTTGVKCYFVI